MTNAPTILAICTECDKDLVEKSSEDDDEEGEECVRRSQKIASKSTLDSVSECFTLDSVSECFTSASVST